MNIKKTIKKMSALATGAVMIGATVMGAIAYDLSNYPYPFVQSDGSFSGYIVVGTQGPNAAGLAQDMVGAIDIGTSLQAAVAAKTAVSVSGGSVSVSGGQSYDDIWLNGNYFTGQSLRQSKLSGFEDTSTDFNGDTIDYHDELNLAANGIGFGTSASTKDFGSDIYMTSTANAINYTVVFDDFVDPTTIGSGADQDKLKFDFLGETLTVNKATNNQSITVESSKEKYLTIGQTITIDGHKVTLVNVGSTSAIVQVDGQSQVLTSVDNSGTSKKFDQAGNYQVEVESVFYNDKDPTNNGADMKLGDKLTQSASNGDSAQIFGQPSRNDEADWIWAINLNSTTGQYIGIESNIKRDKLDNDSTHRPALSVGQSINLPNDYASVEFYRLNEPGAYEDLQVSLDDSINLNDNNGHKLDGVKGVHFTLDSGKSFFKVDGIDTSDVYVVNNGGTTETWYSDGNYEDNATSTAFTLTIDKDVITITPPSDLTPDLSGIDTFNFSNATLIGMDAFKLNFDHSGSTVDNMYFLANVNNDFFGNLDQEEANELYDANATAGIGTKDYDYVTNYGALISNPKSQFSGGSSFDIQLPVNRQGGVVLVSSSGTQVGSVGSSGVTQLPVGLAILDKDAASMVGSDNLIVVGGPYVNTVSAELMGNPTDAQIQEMFAPGKAKIKLYPSQNAILVAGYSAQDTTGAARVLADYSKYALTGNEVEVLVPSLTSISVGQPTLPSDVSALTTTTPMADNASMNSTQ